MIGLDTNVLVRYVVRDDEREARAATKLIESRCSAEDPGIVTLVVLCELVWVLLRGYRYERPVVVKVLRGILSAQELRVEDSDLAWIALRSFEQGRADFSDFVIALSGHAAGAEATYTFDRQALETPLFRRVGA